MRSKSLTIWTKFSGGHGREFGGAGLAGGEACGDHSATFGCEMVAVAVGGSKKSARGLCTLHGFLSHSGFRSASDPTSQPHINAIDRSAARYTCYAQRNGPGSGSSITCPLSLGARNWTCEVNREQRGLAHSKTWRNNWASVKRYVPQCGRVRQPSAALS
jgi:hypothetical protein